MTFDNFAVPAVKIAKQNVIKGKTLQCDYIGPLQSRINPFFADKPICNIGYNDVQDYVYKYGRKFSVETLKKDIVAIKLGIRFRDIDIDDDNAVVRIRVIQGWTQDYIESDEKKSGKQRNQISKTNIVSG